MTWGKCDMKIGEKCESWQASFWFTLINQQNRQKRTCSRNYKSHCNLLIFMKPFKRHKKAIFCASQERQEKGVWSRLRARADGTSWSNITSEIFLWKVNFSSSKNFLEGFTFSVVPFLLVQLIDLETLWTQFSVNSRPLPNSFNKPKMQKT